MTLSAAVPEPRRGRLEQVVAIVAVFLGLAAGYTCSFGGTTTTFILPLTKEFHWGRTIPSLMFVAATAGIALSSVFVGRAISRFGFAAVAAGSGVCLSTVFVLLSTMPGQPAIAILLCFLAGALGVGTGVGLYIAVLPRWFEADLGRALGFAIVGQSVGLATFPALTASISLRDGWRSAYLTLAVIQLVLTLGAVALLVWLSRRERLRPDASRSQAAATGSTLTEARATRQFWVLAIAIFFATAGTFGTMVHIFPLYADRGVAPALMPSVAVALGIGTLIGRLASGLLLDHVEPRLIGAATFVIGTGAIVWLAYADQLHGTLAVLAPPALVGFALGAETDILAYFARRLFGLLEFTAIYNRLLIAYYFGAIVGPLWLGWAFDNLHDSRGAIIALACSCAASACAFLTLPNVHRSPVGAALQGGRL